MKETACGHLALLSRKGASIASPISDEKDVTKLTITPCPRFRIIPPNYRTRHSTISSLRTPRDLDGHPIVPDTTIFGAKGARRVYTCSRRHGVRCSTFQMVHSVQTDDHMIPRFNTCSNDLVLLLSNRILAHFSSLSYPEFHVFLPCTEYPASKQFSLDECRMHE